MSAADRALERAASGPAVAAPAPAPWRLVLARELTELRRDRRWTLLLALMAALLLAALVLGVQHTTHQAHQRAHAAAGDRHVWDHQGDKNPHAAAHFGQYAFRPVLPLAVFDPGIGAYVGHSVWLEAHRQNEAQFRAARDGTLAARMGRLDLALVFQTVLPLLALLLGHAAWAGERTQGTLRPLMSLGVSPLQLMAGKALALLAVLALLLLLAAGGLTLGLGLAAGPEGLAFDADQARRLAALVAAYALYLAAFALLALAASAGLRDTRLALVLLLGVWIVQCMLAPRAVTEALRHADPLPTAQAFQAAIAEDRRREQFGHDETHPAFAVFRERVLREYGVSRLQDLPVHLRGLSLREDDTIGYRIYDRHFGALQSRLERQDARRAEAGFAVPLLALQSLSTALAGTDNRHHHDFLRQAEGHRRLIQGAVSQDLIDNARLGDTNYVAGPDLWRRIPPFAYAAPPSSWAWQGQGAALAALAAWLLLAVAAAAAAARRLRAD